MSVNPPKIIIGFVFLVLSAALYATMPIIGKIMYHTGLTAVSVLLLRYFFSLTILVVYLAFKKEQILIFSPFAVIQGILFVLGSLLYFNAVKFLPAGLTTSIFYMYPAVVSILAVVIYREKLPLRQITALVLALGGIVIISGFLGEATHRLSLPGIILDIGASLCYTGYTLLGQKTTDRWGALPLTTTLSLCGLIILSLVFPHDVTALAGITLKQAILGMTMAVLNTILSVFFFLKGLAIVGASRAALVSTAEPAFTLLFAFLVLGEVISPLQGIGILLVLVSTTLALKPPVNK